MARSADPVELTTSIVVACHIQQCWDLYTNNALMPEWAPTVSQVEGESNTIALNEHRKNHVLVNGQSGHTVEQCTQLDPLKRIEFNVIEETFGFSHMLNQYGYNVSFDVDSQHTLLVMQTRYVPKKIFASIMTSQSTQQQLVRLMLENLQGFKAFAESR